MCLCRDNRVVHVIDTATKLSIWEIEARSGLPVVRWIMVPRVHMRDFPILCGPAVKDGDLTAFLDSVGLL